MHIFPPKNAPMRCVLNLLLMRSGNLSEVEFHFMPDGPPQGKPIPRRFILDTQHKTVSCSDENVDASLLKYEVAGDGKTATLTIPRALAVLKDPDRIGFVHAQFRSQDRGKVGAGELRTYWRGNQYSVSSPYVYGKFVMDD